VAGLRVDDPKSTLFKFWARSDPAAPGGDGYHFLAVKWSDMGWFFSTDPLRKYDIRSLAERLQVAEVRRDPGRAESDGRDPDPWYDGARFGFTIVRPPHRGTGLSDAEVWRIARRWGRARRVIPRWATAPALGGVAVLLLAAAAWAMPWKDLIPNTQGGGGSTTTNGGGEPDTPKEVPEVVKPFIDLEHAKAQDYPWTADLVPGRKASKEVPLNDAVPGGLLVVWLEGASDARPPDGFTFAWGAAAEARGFGTWTGSGQQWRTGPIRVEVPAGSPRTGVVSVEPGRDAVAGRHSLTLRWMEDPGIHLHVMAVGVSKYKDGKLDLRCGDRDAQDLTAAFKGLEGGPFFAKVTDRPPLVNEKASAEDILTELKAFKHQVVNDRAGRRKLAVVVFSGHGAAHDRHYVFLPRDFDRDREVTHVYWDSIVRYLGDLGCPTVLILDTCHSGQAVEQLQGKGAKSLPDAKAVADAIEAFGRLRPALYVLAAADKDGKAYEPREGEGDHSYLSAAILDVLKGRAKLPHTGTISLETLYQYLKVEVPTRVKNGQGQQVVVSGFPPGRGPDLIPIVYRPAAGPRK
jgi:hypothetical protein